MVSQPSGVLLKWVFFVPEGVQAVGDNTGEGGLGLLPFLVMF